MIASSDIFSPPVKVYSESHHRQRRLHPVRRTKTHGLPACDDSPWTGWKISVRRIGASYVGNAFRSRNDFKCRSRVFTSLENIYRIAAVAGRGSQVAGPSVT